MYFKCYSTFLCVLLASTFVQELGANRLTIERATGDRNIFPLNVEICEKHMIISNYNSNVALAINVMSGNFILLDGKGAALQVDHINHTGKHYSNVPYNARDFLKSVDCKDSNLKYETGTFSLDDISYSEFDIATYVVKDLVAFIDPAFRHDVSLGWDLATVIVNGIWKLTSTTLKGLTDKEVLGDEPIKLNMDIAGALNVLQAIADLLVLNNKTLASLVSQGCALNISKILSADNGTRALAIFLAETKGIIDPKILARLLNNLQSLLDAQVQFGGDVTFGFTGLAKSIAEPVALANNNASLASIVGYELQYIAYSTVFPRDLTEALTKDLGYLREVTMGINSKGILNKSIQLFDDALSNQLSYAGINLSNIIKINTNVVAGRSNNLLVSLCEVLLELRPIRTAQEIFITLLIVLIAKLDSPVGIEQLIEIGINLTCTDIEPPLCIPNHLTPLVYSSQDYYDVLDNMEISGSILSALNGALSEVLPGKDTLQTLFNEMPQGLFDLLKGVVEVITHKTQGVPTDLIGKAEELVKLVNSFKSLISVTVYV